MKNEEIEIKLQFRNKKKIISILGKKIKFQKRFKVYDRYYGRNHSDMNNVHSLIRIREIKNGNAELTYKGKTKDRNNIWHRVELTTLVVFPKIMGEILNNIGFKKISEYRSEKECWEFDSLKIIFSKFTSPAYLEFVEIEGRSEKKIKELIKKLGRHVKEVGEEIFEIFDKNKK